jgi:hypothetical protein
MLKAARRHLLNIEFLAEIQWNLTKYLSGFAMRKPIKWALYITGIIRNFWRWEGLNGYGHLVFLTKAWKKTASCYP